MNSWIDTVKTKAMHFGLHAMIWATWVWELTRDWSVKTWTGALEAHQPLTWVFFKRNQHPWPVRGSMPVHFAPLGTYCPESGEFSFDSTMTRHHDLESVVSATLICPGMVREDASWFFLALKWCGDSAPSLLEMVVTYLLSEGMMEQVQTLQKCKLVVGLADGSFLRISLNRKKNPAILEPFESWNSYREPTLAPAATPAVEQASTENVSSTSWVELQRDVGEGPIRQDLEDVPRRDAESAETPA